MKDIWAGIAARHLLPLLLAVMLGLSFGLTGCEGAWVGKSGAVDLPVASQPSPVKLGGRLSEVAPPAAIQALRQSLDVYQPQVAIVSPRPDEVLSSTTVNVRFQVRDLPIFKDEGLGLGPHLHVILDNQPYQSVYDLDQPLVFKDLEPGTHTLRVFASRPWHESFKNDGAYAQVTFHVLTQTATNRPDPKLPVLTYSLPQGRYGAEPILLDFYLANAPLRLATADNRGDDLEDLDDWRIRVTINGESFVLDHWQPIYLKGFKRGDNWIKLEFLDDRGELVLNAFNNPVRLIQYEPGGKDTLSRLMRGELSASAAQGIVKQTVTTPALKPSPSVVPSPVPPSPVAQPSPSVVPSPVPPSPVAQPSPSVVPSPIAAPPAAKPRVIAEPSPSPSVTATPKPAPSPVASPSLAPATPVPAQPSPPTPAAVPSPVVAPTSATQNLPTTALPTSASELDTHTDLVPSSEREPAARVTPSPAVPASPVTPPLTPAPPIEAEVAAPKVDVPAPNPEPPGPTAGPGSDTPSPATQANRWLQRWRDRLTPTTSPAPAPNSRSESGDVPKAEVAAPDHTAPVAEVAPSAEAAPTAEAASVSE